MAREMDGEEDYFCVDFKPIEVCHVARSKRSKMGRTGDFHKNPDFDYCASQGTYFFGYKLHMLCGLDGVIHSYELSKTNVHDINYIKDIKPLYHDYCIFGDKAYISREVQPDLFETTNIRLEVLTDSPQRAGSQHSFRLQKPGKEWRRCSHNSRINSLSSETTLR